METKKSVGKKGIELQQSKIFSKYLKINFNQKNPSIRDFVLCLSLSFQRTIGGNHRIDLGKHIRVVFRHLFFSPRGRWSRDKSKQIAGSWETPTDESLAWHKTRGQPSAPEPLRGGHLGSAGGGGNPWEFFQGLSPHHKGLPRLISEGGNTWGIKPGVGWPVQRFRIIFNLSVSPHLVWQIFCLFSTICFEWRKMKKKVRRYVCLFPFSSWGSQHKWTTR